MTTACKECGQEGIHPMTCVTGAAKYELLDEPFHGVEVVDAYPTTVMTPMGLELTYEDELRRPTLEIDLRELDRLRKVGDPHRHTTMTTMHAVKERVPC